MSVCKQAMAARRKAKHDVRYNKRARKDLGVRAAKLQALIAREKERQSRK